MKKILVIFAVVCLSVFPLCSCSLFENILKPGPEPTATPDPSAENVIAAISGSIDLDSLSYQELSALYDDFLKNDSLNAGAEYDLIYSDVEIKPNDPTAEIDFESSENTKTAVVSDEPWVDKTFEALDPTANMSPEDKAGYEAMIRELDNFDAAEFQAEIDEMLKGTEGFEDYEPVEPDDSQLLNEWPDNEITRQIPKPSFENPIIVESDDGLTVMQMGSSAEEAQAYARQLKDAGFTRDVNENTQEFAGISIYTFVAQNAKGLSVSLTFASGTTTVSISKK